MKLVVCLLLLLLADIPAPASELTSPAPIPHVPAVQANPDARSRSQSLIAEGVRLFEDRFDREALTAFEKAEALAKEAGWEDGVMDARLGQARIHAGWGKIRANLPVYREAIAHYEKKGETAKVAETLLNMANSVTTAGEPVEARIAREKALTLAEKVGDPTGIALALVGLARSRTAEGDVEEAARLLDRAEESAGRGEASARRAYVAKLIGLRYQDLGRPDEAMVLLDRARLEYARLGRPVAAAFCDVELALLHGATAYAPSSTGQAGSAQMLLDRALNTFRETGCIMGESFARSRKVGEYRYTKPAEAVARYGELYALDVGSGNLFSAVQQKLFMGLAAKHIVQMKMADETMLPEWEAKALRYFEEARQMASNSVDYPWILGWCEMGTGALHDAGGRYLEAIQCFQRARAVFVSTGDRDNLAGAHMREAGAYRKAGNPRKALETLAQALPIYAELRERVPDPSLAAVKDYEGLTYLPGDMAILAVEVGDSRLAFEMLQRLKGGAVRNALLNRPDGKADVSTEDADRLRTLREACNAAESALAVRQAGRTEPPGQGRVLADLVTARDRAVAELSAFEALLQARSPRWARREAKPVSVEQVAASLGPDTALLETFSLDGSTYLILLRSRNGRPFLTSRKFVHPKGDLWDLVGDLNRSIQDNRSESGFSRHSRALYDILVAPFEPDLDGIRTLVFCSDAGMPAGALLDRNGKYLIERFAIAAAPSASAWEACRSLSRDRVGEKAEPPLVAAISTFAARPKLVASLPPGAVRRDGSMADLPHVKKEAALVRKAMGPSTVVLSEENATVENVMAKVEGARLLHMATHAVPNETVPMQGAFILSPSPENPLGLLRAQDIYGLNLRADLAVLSACATDKGLATVDGMMGLSWAFLVAGCPRIIASRWDVDDKATGRWMEVFYASYAGGKNTTAESVRQATLALIATKGTKADYSSPRHWAAWTLLGNDL